MAKPASSHPETGETKPNFHITPEQKAQLDWLRSEIGVPNTTEAIRSCINVMVALKRQLQPGSQLFLHTPQGQVRLLIPELEPLPTETWQYLVERPHPWRRLHQGAQTFGIYCVARHDLQPNVTRRSSRKLGATPSRHP